MVRTGACQFSTGRDFENQHFPFSVLHNEQIRVPARPAERRYERSRHSPAAHAPDYYGKRDRLRIGLCRIYFRFIWVIIFGLLAIFLFVVTLAFSPLTAIICLTVIIGIANGLMCRKLFRHLLFLVPLIALLIFLPHLTEWEPVKKANLPDTEYLALILLLPVAVTMAAKGFTKKYPHTKYMILSLICSILLIFSVDFIFENIMQEHQRTRIENLLGLKEDLKGAGYNVHQSKIAIGSGGLTGKGFLQGTQTKYNFVPEQSTDFIFCTIGEEWGFVGSALTVIVYVFLIGRILNLAEKQKDSFARLYGYCIASCFFMHFFINIGMTMGLVPVIGIPLPFLSYGGSSLWTFTILLFIFIKLDSERWNY